MKKQVAYKEILLLLLLLTKKGLATDLSRA
jgi:hypothetical protein